MQGISRQASFALATVAVFTAYTLTLAAVTQIKAANRPNAAAIHNGERALSLTAADGSSPLAREAAERHMNAAADCLLSQGGRWGAKSAAGRFASVKRSASRTTTSKSYSPVSVDQIFHGPRGTKRVALTFDVESGEGALPQILGALKQANAKATFFILGNWATTHPQLARRMTAEGHEIANHSFNHPAMTTMPDESVASEIIDTDKNLRSITRRRPSRLFRPPYGDCDQRILAIAASKGFKTVMWNSDPGDWRAAKTPEDVIESVANTIADGDVVVLHTSNSVTGIALPSILERLEAQGLRQVTVSSLLGLR